MKTTINERLKIFWEYRGMTYGKFAEKAELSISGFKAYIIGGTSPTMSALEKIVKAFPELNPSWLFMGSGEMLLASESQAQIIAAEKLLTLEEQVEKLKEDNNFLRRLLQRDLDKEFVPAAKLKGVRTNHKVAKGSDKQYKSDLKVA